MRRDTQLDIGREIVERIAQNSTPFADDLYRNEPAVYTDQARHEAELPVFFGSYPLVMGTSVQVPNPGDVLTDDHTDVPVLMVRGTDGKIRAFANVCRHRGSRLVLDDADCGLKAITCPYHAWVYGLDGALRAVPGDGFDQLDRSTSGLVQLPATERAGLIWVQPKPVDGAEIDLGAEVDAMLGTELLADLEAFDIASHHHYTTRHLSRRLNWKLTLDTFFESYHFRQLHKTSIAPLVKSDLAPVRHYGDNHLMVAVRHSAEALADQPEDQWDLIDQTVLVYLLWPNTIFLYQRDHLEMFRVFPGETVADSEIELIICIPDNPDDSADPAKARKHWDANIELLVQTADTEDFSNGATIQRSFEAGVLDEVVYGRNEPLMHSWHRSLKRAMADKLPS